MPLPSKRIAIIGSFRQNYKEILEAWTVFTEAGLEVTSPKGSPIIGEGIPFVRFQTDALNLNDNDIQSLALHRILRAHLTYVVAPRGYIGNTTSYEIGRVIQAGHALYFSETPKDLPIHVPSSHVIQPKALMALLSASEWQPGWIYDESNNENYQLERELLDGIYRPD